MLLGVEIGFCQCLEGSQTAAIPDALTKVIAGIGVAGWLLGILTCYIWKQRGKDELKAAWGAVRGLLCRERTPRERRISEFIEEKRFDTFTLLINYFTVLAVPGVFAGDALASFFALLPQRLQFMAMYLVHMFLCALCLFYYNFPRQWTVRAANFFFYSAFVSLGVLPALATTLDDYYFAVTMARALHMVVAVVSPSLWFFLPLNLLHLAWELAVICTNPVLQSVQPQNFFLSIFTTALVLGVNVVIRVLLGEWAKAELESEQVSHKAAKVTTLLTHFCDCLITLSDEDLTFAEDSQAFGTLLELQPEAVKAGESFRSLLQSSDQERFVDFVAEESTEEQDQVRQMSLDLEDQKGGRVLVDLYRIGWTDPVECTQKHLVAIVRARNDQLVTIPSGLTNLEALESKVDLIKEAGILLSTEEGPGPEDTMSIHFDSMQLTQRATVREHLAVIEDTAAPECRSCGFESGGFTRT